MCIGVPMKVLSCTGGIALAVGRGEHARLDAMLLDDLQPGAWVLAFRGVALRTLSDEEAARSDAALDALQAVLAGDGASIDAHFRDLVDREPQLPAHLRGARA